MNGPTSKTTTSAGWPSAAQLFVLLWVQPFYWLLRRKLRLDQELLADAAAADTKGRQQYAAELVAWARSATRRPRMPAAAAVGLWEGPSQLRRRVALLLDERFTMLRKCSRKWQLTSSFSLVAAAAMLSLITVQPRTAAQTTPGKESIQAETPTSKNEPIANSRSRNVSGPASRPGASGASEKSADAVRTRLRELAEAAAPSLATMAQEDGYNLQPGEVVKRIAPPFAPSRMEYFRAVHPPLGEPDLGPDTIVFRWADERLQGHMSMFFYGPPDPGYDLTLLLYALARITSEQIDGPPILLRKKLSGDWVVRSGASEDDIVKQLQTILQRDFSWPVRLELREVKRPVWIVRGEYKYTPLAGPVEDDIKQRVNPASQVDFIEVFGTQLPIGKSAGSGGSDFPRFLNRLGSWIGAPIVPEVQLVPPRSLMLNFHERSPSNEQTRAEDHDPVTVLTNITRQTGLTFAKEERPVRVLFVEGMEER